ncbi:MAG: helicase-exonuclease AddAB subunit AddA [Lachnospiraceae bacterium]|nr:helicase-exonuclease AddAB subunit AddA [Lachnospiraceae bacterium]
MAVNWTDEQRQAIDLSEQNILVSAAAGSGKTAVLVERILRIVTDPVHPVDVDRLLIVTFTRAAAAEMKDRIGKALEERLRQEPDNEHLQRQGILLHHAQISTIHGFCTYVIQNYFHRIGLDPGYRIAEDSELTMMKRDVIGELLEAEYEKGEDSFLWFIESFAPGRDDRACEDLILRLHEFSVSDPDPEGWLERCLAIYQIDTEQELEESSWLQESMAEGRRLLSDVRDRIRETLELTLEEGGPAAYAPQIETDLRLTEDLLEMKSYGELVQGFQTLKHPALSRKKQEGVNEQLKERVKSRRSGYRKTLEKIEQQYFALPIPLILEELRNCRLNASELVRLTRLFSAAFAERKRKNNVLDFSDLEHFALEILLEKEETGEKQATSEREGGEAVPVREGSREASAPVRWKRTAAARELAQQFHEIMIDEYQDSNFVQEALLRAVSGEEEGRFNRFMVGDIKQSIYGFRQAKPELFLEKYHSYGKEEHTCRIDLKENFRSRGQVLDSANALFQRLMVPSLGGITYDDAAALHRGFDYPETPKGDCSMEVILIDKKDPELEDVKLKDELVEMEALAVAAKIKELMKSQQVYDRKTEGFRPAQYRDFAVLLRSIRGRGEVFLRVLKNEGIPSFAVSKTGYFSTIEVSTVVNYLRILDNPRQDIPYAAVLHSPVAGVTDEELAWIRSAVPEGGLYEIVPKAAELAGLQPEIWSASGQVSHQQGAESASELSGLQQMAEASSGPAPAGLAEKLQHFLLQLEWLRAQVSWLPVHELVNLVLDETGYRSIAGSLPMGEQRLANLNLLVEKAVDFEATSYHGLFQFLRYLDQMEKNQIDFGEVNLYGETADAVGIMTIHKSKGLEYPFVFVSCLGDKFSTMDSKANVIFHADLGVGMNYVDPKKRVRHSTMIKKMIGQRIHLETLAEELRVLYVALTRAKEKLILTALVDDLEKRVTECVQTPSLKEQPLPYGRLAEASTWMDWLLPVLAGTEGFQPVYQMVLGKDHPVVTIDAPVKVRVQTPAAMTMDRIRDTVEKAALQQKLKQVGENPEEIYQKEVRAFLEKKNQWSYPWEYRSLLPSVMSVSELKKKRPSQSDEELYASEPELVAESSFSYLYKESVLEELEEEEYLPAFMREETVSRTGAERGTAYHRFFECVEYQALPDAAQEQEAFAGFVEKQLKAMVSGGKMEQEEADWIDQKDLVIFLSGDTGQRMRKAALAGNLLREKSFLMELPAVELDSAWNMPERILIRGVIDACFQEEGAWVIVDYKTDKVYSSNGSCLVKKYQKQLQFYQRALEQATGLPVKERLIYSVTLGRSIAVSEVS